MNNVGVFWACSGRVLGVFWACSGRVLGVFWACSGRVMLLSESTFAIACHMTDLNRYRREASLLLLNYTAPCC